MTGLQTFWTVVMVIGVLIFADGVMGGAIIASILGPTAFAYFGVPQVVIGLILGGVGWFYSRK